MVFFLASWTYALAVNFSGRYRGAVDAFVGGEGAKGAEMGDRVERGHDGTGVVKPVTDLENMSGVVLTK